MRKANDFHPVDDCQSVFRLLLEAFSNPGRVVDISRQVEKLRSPNGAALAVAATLVDNETTFLVAGNDGLSEEIALQTGSMPEGAQAAGFIFAEPLLGNADIAQLLGDAPCGTLAEPHRCATVFVKVASLDSNPGMALSGPGVNGYIHAPLGDYAGQWLDARDGLRLEYPCGIDLAFLTADGQLVAVPRQVKRAAKEVL